jgi:hypothetical protein
VNIERFDPENLKLGPINDVNIKPDRSSSKGVPKMSETVKQIIQSRLTELGADGLCCDPKYYFRPEIGGCLNIQKVVCDRWIGDCVPGYRHKDGKIHPEKEE